jgi:hypothetical protein
MLILDLCGISFHPVVVVGLGIDLLFNFVVGHCDKQDEFLFEVAFVFLCICFIKTFEEF